uniref:Innexin n=1 Tax=Lymnaea stagnalis TaxID=6523 RepID=A0A6C0X6V8_LYMST|nr:innexin 6 [Lymnaea stagnalis]
MDSLLARAANVVFNSPMKGDDFVDRLHYFVTVAILVCFVIGTGLQEYVGNPINCWTPKDFHYESYQAHVNTYCWTHKLRYPQYEREGVINQTEVSGQGVLDPSRPQPLIDFGTAYYRWVTLIFIVQACLFKIPNFIWLRLSGSSGADIQKIRELVVQSQNASTDDSKRLKMDEVVSYFENWITGYRSYKFRFVGKHSAKVLAVLFCLGKKSGSYMSSLYLCYKCMNIINVVGNFILLTVFLDLNFWKYGLVVLNSVMTYGDWQDPYNFPRLLLCDFILEGGSGKAIVGGSQPAEYQVQCTMTLNLLLEKVFVLEWFWLVFLFIITIVNLISWSVKIKPPCSTILFGKTYIKTVDSYPCLDIGIASMISSGASTGSGKNLQRDFIEKYLRSDGVFILRLLEQKSDRTLVADVVGMLWNRYRAVQKKAVGSNLALYGGMNFGSDVELGKVKYDAGSDAQLAKDDDVNVQVDTVRFGKEGVTDDDATADTNT